MTKAKTDLVKIEILKDGVFPMEDVRKDKGDTAEVSSEVAKALEESGHVKRV